MGRATPKSDPGSHVEPSGNAQAAPRASCLSSLPVGRPNFGRARQAPGAELCVRLACSRVVADEKLMERKERGAAQCIVRLYCIGKLAVVWDFCLARCEGDVDRGSR
jgi:hypothetical protein